MQGSCVIHEYWLSLTLRATESDLRSDSHVSRTYISTYHEFTRAIDDISSKLIVFYYSTRTHTLQKDRKCFERKKGREKTVIKNFNDSLIISSKNTIVQCDILRKTDYDKSCLSLITLILITTTYQLLLTSLFVLIQYKKFLYCFQQKSQQFFK